MYVYLFRSLVAYLAAANHFTKDHLAIPENRDLMEKAQYFYMAVSLVHIFCIRFLYSSSSYCIHHVQHPLSMLARLARFLHMRPLRPHLTRSKAHSYCKANSIKSFFTHSSQVFLHVRLSLTPITSKLLLAETQSSLSFLSTSPNHCWRWYETWLNLQLEARSQRL